MDTYSTRPARYSRPLRALILGGLIALSSLGPAAAGAPVTMDGLTADQEALVEKAVGLYTAAGLELPQVRLVGSADPAPCEGRAGVAFPREDHTEIVLCTAAAGPAEEWVIIHELAHAWDHHSLTEDRKAAFQSLRNAPSWRSRDVAWHERAAEQAAEIMVWALIDRPVGVIRIYDNSCEQMHEAYETLTGLAPLHGYEDHC